MSEETHKRVRPYPHPKHPTIQLYEDAEAYYGEKWTMYQDPSCSCCGCCGYFNIFDNSTHKHLAAIRYDYKDYNYDVMLEHALVLVERADINLLSDRERAAAH